jgi:hypothetical protein
MSELTTDQRTTLAIIDAADSVARSAGETAIALQEAARALRLAVSPRGGSVTFAICTLCAGGGGGEAQPEPDAQEPVSDPVEAACGGTCADGVAKEPVNEPDYAPRGARRYTSAEPYSYVVNERSETLDFAIERARAGFSPEAVWVGGAGPSEGPAIYWSEADRGITHTMLMDACEGLSDAERRTAHALAAGLAIGQSPTVTDLLAALAEIHERKLDAAPECSLLDVADELDALPEFIPHEDELVEQINARFGQFDSASLAAQAAVEAPKHAEPSTPVAKSDAVSLASPAGLDTVKGPGVTRGRAADLAASVWDISASASVEASASGAVCA